MKKLLFIYPIEEFMKIFEHGDVIEKLNRTINKRYREKGYEINYLIFPDKEIADLQIYPNDKIIKTDITFEDYTTTNKAGNFPNPNLDKIFGENINVESIVVCGFDSRDYVRKTAKRFDDLGFDTLIDIELSGYFRAHCEKNYFAEDEYNLANIIEYMESKGINTDSMYLEPYYKKHLFKSTLVKSK